jgi:hypothetical protein
VKLYLLVAVISNCLIFNVKNSAEKESFKKICHQIITHLELLNIPVPPIYIIVRDCDNESLKNMLKLQIQLDDNSLKSAAREHIRKQFLLGNYFVKERIFFMESPPTDDDGNEDTSDKNSNFYRDNIEICNKLLNDNIQFERDISSKQKIVNFLWSYKISDLNKNALENMSTKIINDVINSKYQIIFKGTVNGYSNCKNVIQDYKNRLIQETTVAVKSQLIRQLDNSTQNLINSKINEKVNSLLNSVESNYSTQVNNYNARREQTSRNDPVYAKRTVKISYQAKERYYPGCLQSYCTSCNQLSNTPGCTRQTNHTDSWHREKSRILFIQVKGRGYFR